MADVTAPGRPFQKYRRAFVSNLPQALDGSVDGVHDGRVASRRLREALAILGAELPKSRARKLRRRLRRVTRVLGPVRELDVVDQILAEILRTKTAPGDAVRAVRRWVAGERATWRRALRRRLKPAVCTKLRRSLLTAERGARTLPADGRWRRRLAVRIGRRAAKARGAIGKAGRLYDAGRIHDVRISLKQLRYALEFAEQARVVRCQPIADRIKVAQDCLGELHDQEVVLHHVRTIQAAGLPRDGRARQLEALVRLLEEECRRLHARYVVDQPAVLEACEAASTLADELRVAAGKPDRRAAPLKMTLDRAATGRQRVPR